MNNTVTLHFSSDDEARLFFRLATQSMHSRKRLDACGAGMLQDRVSRCVGATRGAAPGDDYSEGSWPAHTPPAEAPDFAIFRAQRNAVAGDAVREELK